MNLGGFFAGLGNTVGSLIPYTCPHCGETWRISEYGGNIVEGADCPGCGKDPTRHVERQPEEEKPAVKQWQTSTPSADFTMQDYDKYEVKNHFISRIEWREGVETKIVKVYDESAYQWQKIGEQLGLEHGQLVSIRRDCHDDRERVTTVIGIWYDNANNLSNSRIYPKTWSGLIALLNSSDLGMLANKLYTALSSPQNSVRGNM